MQARTEKRRRQAAEIRGPVCPDFVATSISAITAFALEKIFNKVISGLAANSFFPKNVHAVPDSSEIESTERCPAAASRRSLLCQFSLSGRNAH